MHHQIIGTESDRTRGGPYGFFQRVMTVTDSAKRNFIVQLGFAEPDAAILAREYSALTFQPRIVLIGIVTGILFQSQTVFAGLGALLIWSALVPKLNPLTALHNMVLGSRPGAYRIGPAPAPRRGAERTAGAFALTIALAIHAGFNLPAYVLQAMFLAAALAVEFRGLCLGSFIYHLLSGRSEFAFKTLPWAS